MPIPMAETLNYSFLYQVMSLYAALVIVATFTGYFIYRAIVYLMSKRSAEIGASTRF